MANPTLVLPGVLFVGEDERSRLIAHTGPAAGWFVPRGIGAWSNELSVVAREDLTDEIRAATKLVMPEEQIPPAKNPLTLQAAQKSPIVGVASKLAPKLVEAGVRVHTVGMDRVTSSFYYLAEGGGEDAVRVEGDLVQAVGTMLGERADNAAIERVLDGLADRLLRALSRGRVSELSLELAAALPRAASDGTGAQDVDLDGFERDLAKLVGASEKYTTPLRQIGADLEGTNERRLSIPLYVDARKVSQGPFDLTVGERRVSLPTYERWVLSGPFVEPGAAPKPAAAPSPKPAAVAPRPASNPPPRPQPAKADKPLDAEDALLAKLEEKVIAADDAAAKAKPAEAKPAEAKVEAKPAEAKVEAKPAEAKVEAKAEAKPAETKPEPAVVEAPKVEAKADEKKAEAKADEKKAEAKKADEKKADEKKAEAKKADEKKADEKKADEKKADEKKAEAKKADEKKAQAKKADEKKAEKKPSDRPKKGKGEVDEKRPQAAIETAKTRKAEPAAKSSGTTWLVLLVAIAAAAWVAWRFFLNKH